MWHRKPLRSVCLGVTALIGALGLGVAAMGYAPEALLARSYADALRGVPTAWETRLSGDLWLSLAPTGEALHAKGLWSSQPLRAAFSVGDKIKISARTGTEETIVVTALEEFDGERLGLSGLQLQMVTGKPSSGASGETVRFLFAIETPAASPASAKSGRSL